MPKTKVSYSMTKEIDSAQRSSSGSKEVEMPENNVSQKKITEYERQRMKRIEENRTRMEALGLRRMANSFVGSLPKSAKKTFDRKGKRKMDDDDEYRPSEGEEALGSSSEEDDKNVDDDEDFSVSSAKRKAKNKIRTPKKKVSPQKPLDDLDFVDDNEALLQAIALSLQDSAVTDVKTVASQSSTLHPVNSMTNEEKENSHDQEDTGKRKRKKSINSRVQMTKDELILHFFQFDEAGKGSITLRDLRRVAVAHDFTWSDKEMADMIKCFDSDGDGKLSLDDFCKIAGRCNMIQAL